MGIFACNMAFFLLISNFTIFSLGEKGIFDVSFKPAMSVKKWKKEVFVDSGQSSAVEHLDFVHWKQSLIISMQRSLRNVPFVKDLSASELPLRE